MTVQQTDEFFGDVKSAAVKSVKWNALGEVVSCILPPVVTLILARLLLPEDFGLVGIAMVFMGFAQTFFNYGLGKVLIQRQTQVRESATTAFWMEVAFAILFAVIVVGIAPVASRFFHDSRVIPVLRILSIQIVFFSFISVQQALLRRNFEFKRLFYVRLFAVFIPGCVSIPLALSGFGVWALVYGTLAGTCLQVVLLWKLSSWRPELTYDLHIAKDLLKFGGWVILEGLVLWLLMWGDSIVLGRFLGVQTVGVYRVGMTLLIFAFGIFLNPLLPVAYSAFSRLQQNRQEMQQSFLKTTKIVAYVALPLGVGFYVLAPSLAAVIFGEKWAGIEVVIALIGIAQVVSWLVGINPEVYRAMGRPDINFKLLMIAAFYYIPVYIIAAPHGLFVFCMARLAVALAAIPLHLWVCWKVLGILPRYLIGNINRSLVSSVIAGSFVYILTKVFVRGIMNWHQIIAAFLLYAACYIFIIWIIDKTFIQGVYRMVKHSLYEHPITIQK